LAYFELVNFILHVTPQFCSAPTSLHFRVTDLESLPNRYSAL